MIKTFLLGVLGLFLCINPAFADAPKANAQGFYENGAFSARLLIIPIDQLAEFEKPSNQLMILKEKSEAITDDTVIFKILFYGFEQKSDLSTDVTFDIFVISPDGSVYSNSKHENLAAIVGKTPNNSAIYDNAISATGIHFEAKDPRGVYKVFVKLHDNIGKREISLTNEITLN